MKILAANTILYCSRWKKTANFYRSVLRLPVTHSTDWFVEFSLAETARLSIADASRATVESAAGKGVTLSLRVEDVTAARSCLMVAGVQVTEVRCLWGAQVAYFTDPEGNRIEIWSSRNG